MLSASILLSNLSSALTLPYLSIDSKCLHSTKDSWNPSEGLPKDRGLLKEASLWVLV